MVTSMCSPGSFVPLPSALSMTGTKSARVRRVQGNSEGGVLARQELQGVAAVGGQSDDVALVLPQICGQVLGGGGHRAVQRAEVGLLLGDGAAGLGEVGEGLYEVGRGGGVDPADGDELLEVLVEGGQFAG